MEVRAAIQQIAVEHRRRYGYRRIASELIQELNPTQRGWAEYYKRAHVRALFHKLDGWIVRRIWSHRFCRWRT